jgi:hypothetical protein
LSLPSLQVPNSSTCKYFSLRIHSQALNPATISSCFLPNPKYHGQLGRSRVVLGMWEQNGEHFRIRH